MTILVQGSFKSTGVAVNIPIPASADYFVVFNQTQAATTQGTGRGIKFEWFSNPSMAANSSYKTYKTNSSSALNETLDTTNGGFTYIGSYPAPEAAVTGTTISQATAAVTAITNTYSEGDRVVIYGSTGMAQIGGMEFVISSVSSSAFTLLGLDSSGFSAGASAFKARRVPLYNQMLPQFMYVTAISQAAQAEVTVSQPHNFYLGQKLVFQVPKSFGMTEINENNLNGIPVIVTAITGTNTPTGSGVYKFKVNVNSAAFTAFAFPLSSASPTAPLFATVAPAGSSTAYDPLLQTYTGYDFNKMPFRSSQQFPLMYLAAGAQSPAGSTDDVIVWQAWKAPVVQYASNA